MFSARGPATYWLGKRVRSNDGAWPQSERGHALRITEIGESVLHTPAHPVTRFGTPELLTLIDDMFATMDVAEGVGLAAPQIGVPLRVFVYDVDNGEGRRDAGAVVNPVLTTDEAQGTETVDEGCLSIPGAYIPLARPATARIAGFDSAGRPIRLRATGYLARCFVHEAQHLDGILYYDHLSSGQQAEALHQRDANRAGVLAARHDLAEELGKEPAEYPEAPAGGR
jgi:peptide deformylase